MLRRADDRLQRRSAYFTIRVNSLLSDDLARRPRSASALSRIARFFAFRSALRRTAMQHARKRSGAWRLPRFTCSRARAAASRSLRLSTILGTPFFDVAAGTDSRNAMPTISTVPSSTYEGRGQVSNPQVGRSGFGAQIGWWTWGGGYRCPSGDA